MTCHKELKTIVSICGDPGGANALAPVVRDLSQKAIFYLKNYTYAQGSSIFQKQNLSTTPLSCDVHLETAHSALEETKPDLLLTATSHNTQNWEKKFILSARNLGIPSVSILDFWSNYSLRFSDERGALSCLPDAIIIMDEQAKSEMIAEGFPEDRLLVMGQPAFDSLPRSKSAFTENKKLELRHDLGVSSNEKLVVFVSQPLRQVLNGKTTLGFDEHEVLRDLIFALEPLSEQSPISLLIRPHPREEVSDYDKYHSDRIPIQVSNDGESHSLYLSADLVVGMNSVALVEACHLDCHVLSYQPGLVARDSLPTNRSGLSHAVYAKENLLPKLASLLSAPRPVNSSRFCSAASEKIVKYLSSQFAGPILGLI